MKNYSLIIVLFLSLIFFGCTNTNNSINSAENSDSNQTTNTDNKIQADRYILMAGQIFTKDWFKSWGWQPDQVMTTKRFSMEFVETKSRETFISDIRKAIDNKIDEERDLVYIQLPAEFFAGGSQVEEVLDSNKKLIEDIYALVATEYNMKIIFGNAIPKSIDDTDIYLVWSHQEFNSWLNDFWRDHSDNVTIFNVYDLLSNDLGTIADDMNDKADSAYLNPDVYKFLDSKFFEMLENLY